MSMTRFHTLILVASAIAIITLPQWAEARAGGGRSMGSRGASTFQSVPHAQPIDRTATSQPATTPAQPATGGFWGGLGGGLLGAGLFGMLFGHLFMGGGGLFPMLLMGGVIYYLYTRFKGRGFAPAAQFNAPQGFGQNSSYTPPTYVSSSALITDADKDEFEQLLEKIQHAWSEGDLTRMRQFVTPEMVQYFSEELSANASRGLANKVEQVRLLEADIVQSWHELDFDYATAQLKWSALDYMIRLDRNPGDADYIASGSQTAPDTAQEIWTFVRASGGHWLLSAIQQME